MNHGTIIRLGVAGLLAGGLAMVPILLAQTAPPVATELKVAGSLPDSPSVMPGRPRMVNREKSQNLEDTSPPVGRLAFVEMVTEEVTTRVVAPPRGPAGTPSLRKNTGQPELPSLLTRKPSPYTGILLVGAQPAPPVTDPAASPFPMILGKDPPPAGITAKSVVATPDLASAGPSDLLSKSNDATGVEVQRRSPLIGDPRIEGMHFGQIITQADGAYWFPARIDLDTVVSKMNSDNIGNLYIVKGPFSSRYGPGFSFLDIESLATPRFNEGCFDARGSTGATYRTNAGQAVQQSIWGGSSDWGFRLNYEGQSANDYTTGNGTKIPSAYNNHFVSFAYGVDLSRTESVELRYLHVQQNNVLIPGLLTNINGLTTDGFTARFTAIDGNWFDRLTLDAWVNNTRFNGDSANQGTRNQIPQLNDSFPTVIPANVPINTIPGVTPIRLDITTDGNALSYGAREITTWGDPKGFNFSLGADIRVFASNYNEFDSFNFSVANGSVGTTGTPINLGIPAARMVDPGIFFDSSIPYGDDLTFKLGGRADFASTDFLNFGPNVDQASYNAALPNAQGTKNFFMFSGFAANEHKLSDAWTVQSGYGYAQRPPTLTELYTGGAFLGLIQNGFNSVLGNPNLRKEQLHQLDFSVKAEYELFRFGAHAFYAFAPDYITYDASQGLFTTTTTVLVTSSQSGGPSTGPSTGPTFTTTRTVTGTTKFNKLRFVNTQLATLYGFDGYLEHDVLSWLTPFANLSYVQVWDQTKDEALPGIPPLSSRAGVRFHEPGKNPRWNVEYYARMVATQDLFAASLGEQRTSGFVVHNLRAYWQARENILLLAGVENFGDRQYREHLDLRTGTPLSGGVFQPGINFYVGTKISY